MALASALCWGLAYTLVDKILRAGVHPFLFLGVSSLAQALIFAVLFVRMGEGARLPAQLLQASSLAPWFVLGIAAYVAGNWLIFAAIHEKNAAMANLVEISYPLFTLAFSYWIWREVAVNGWALAGGCMILCGVGLIYAKG